MAFHEVRFPTNISYGSRGGPGGRTQIIAVDSGAEERVIRWATQRRKYDASYGVKSHDDLSEIIDFYIARMGPAFGFRWKDFSDFSTAQGHRNLTLGGPADYAFDDVVIGTADGSTTQFQLIKRYSSGPTVRTRTITKPVNGSVAIGVNGIETLSGWSVDTTTGIVTFSVAPAAGDITWGGEFDVPVRFGEELDEVLSVAYDDYGSGSLPSIPVVEILEGGIQPDEFDYGGATHFDLSADITITPGHGRCISVDPTGAGRKIILPDEDSLPPGGPYFFIVNLDGALSVSVVRPTSMSLLITIAANSAVEVWLGKDSGGNNEWYAF